MEQDKNLHASIPAALLAEAERIAAASHVSMDELMHEAVQSIVEERSWREVFEFGKKQASKLGYTEEDVERLVHEFREGDRAGKYHDSDPQ
jgi:metal-responsive CopG/Arc/MetJ family transcriptional regulator